MTDSPAVSDKGIVENLTIDALNQELKRKHHRPAYLLLGPELYLRNQAVRLLKRTVPPEAMAFNYSEFQAKGTTSGEIADTANTFPMMSPLRLVVVHNVDQLPESEHEGLIAYLERPATRAVLVLVASDLDRRTSFCRRLLEFACVLEFPELRDYALRAWVEDFIRRQNRRMSPATLNRLMDLAGSDLLSLVNELEKLFLYAGDTREISETMVEQLVPSSRAHKLYELTDAIGRKDRRNALRLITNLLQSGEAPLRISATLASHFRQVLIVRELLDSGQTDGRVIAAAAQTNPRWIDNLIRTARAVDLKTARQMCLSTAEIDRRLKSSGIDQKLILESLVHSL